PGRHAVLAADRRGPVPARAQRRGRPARPAARPAAPAARPPARRPRGARRPARPHARPQSAAPPADAVRRHERAGAVRVALGGPFDLVLLDLNLPCLDGLEVCRRLRELGGAAPLKIIIVSGRGDQNTLAEVLAQGADDYVAKPYEPSQLAAKVQAAFRLQDAQARAAQLAGQLLGVNR